MPNTENGMKRRRSWPSPAGTAHRSMKRKTRGSRRAKMKNHIRSHGTGVTFLSVVRSRLFSFSEMCRQALLSVSQKRAATRSVKGAWGIPNRQAQNPAGWTGLPCLPGSTWNCLAEFGGTAILILQPEGSGDI